MRIIVFSISVLSIAACAPVQNSKPVNVDRVSLAVLKTSNGETAGVATLSDRADGLWLTVTASRRTPGTYGIHLHAVGKCDGPDFTTAGPHWNPTQKQHGFDNPMGTHAGDIRNLNISTSGSGAMAVNLAGAQFEGPTGLLDADGVALVIHEKADDYTTDPSGNSGKRVICGVFTKQ